MNTPLLNMGEYRIPEKSSARVRKSQSASTLGFLVTDSALKPLSANHEAIAILTYGKNGGRPTDLVETFETKFQSELLRLRSRPSSTHAPRSMQFTSGRRTYFCRAFLLEAAHNLPGSPGLLIVLERGISESVAISQISDQFRLTRREHEAMTLLLEGLSNKEMADRMAISANTVKALLRLLMAKMQVSSRSTVVATVLGLMMSPRAKLN